LGALFGGLLGGVFAAAGLLQYDTHMHKGLLAGSVLLGIAALTVATVFLAVHVASQQTHSTAQTNQACKGAKGVTHIVTIKKSVVSPSHTTALLCDRLAITNLDDTARLMAFGVHEKHQAYDGVIEKALTKGQSASVTLVQAGNFKFHDHVHDEVQGTFTVTQE